MTSPIALFPQSILTSQSEKNFTVPKGQVRTFNIGVSQAGSELFEAWREAHLVTFDVAARAAQIEAFHGSLQIWATRRFILSKDACTAVCLVRSRAPSAAMLLDHLGIRLVVGGNVKGDVGTRKIVAGAGDIICFDLDQAMRLETSTDGGASLQFLVNKADQKRALLEMKKIRPTNEF